MPDFPYFVKPFPTTVGPEAWGKKDPIPLPKRYANCAQLSRTTTEIEYDCDKGVLLLVKTVDVFTGVPAPGNPGACEVLHSINVYRIAVGHCDPAVHYPQRPVGPERAVWLAAFEKYAGEIAKEKH